MLGTLVYVLCVCGKKNKTISANISDTGVPQISVGVIVYRSVSISLSATGIETLRDCWRFPCHTSLALVYSQMRMLFYAVYFPIQIESLA